MSYFKTIKCATSDTTNQIPRLDRATHTLQTIDYAHHEIHAGSHFMYHDCITLANNGTQDYLITTPDSDKWPHLSFEVNGSAITAIDLYEETDKDGTTLQTIFNNDRNSENDSVITIHKGVSGGTTDGTKIWCHKSGSATQQSRSGANSEQASEIILKQDTKYILRITSSTNDNLINLALEWYEHTNKEA